MHARPNYKAKLFPFRCTISLNRKMNIIISIKYVQLEKLETTAAKFNVAPRLVFRYSFVDEWFRDKVKPQLSMGNLEDRYYHI